MATRRTPTPDQSAIPPEGARDDSTQRDQEKAPRTGSVARAERPENSLEVVAQVHAARASQAKRTGKASSVETSNEAASAAPGQAVPEHIRARYLKAGNQFHFTNRDLAFTDHGNKLSTRVENTEVISDLIEIAKSRGWNEINLSGTKEFRQEAWVQANVAGISVRNYRATELDQEMLRRRLGKTAVQESSPALNSSTNPAAEAPRQAAAAQRDRINTTPGSRGEREPGIGETFTGRLVKQGRLDSNEYQVELRAGNRVVTLRGDDLRRAVKESLTQPKVGEEVSVRYFGPETVKVTRPVQGEDGQVRPEAYTESTVNRWSVERSDFVQARAALSRVVRDAGIDGTSAVRQHPSLSGVYMELQAAQLKAREQFQSPEAQQQFVDSVRAKLAQDVERGKPLPANLLPPKEAARVRREIVQERTL